MCGHVTRGTTLGEYLSMNSLPLSACVQLKRKASVVYIFIFTKQTGQIKIVFAHDSIANAVSQSSMLMPPTTNGLKLKCCFLKKLWLHSLL